MPLKALVDVLPDVAHELHSLLVDAGHDKLAAQVPRLKLHGRCRCGDSFCATFYTAPQPEGSYGPDHRNVVLNPKRGEMILDVVAGQIVCVEILERGEIRARLKEEYP